MQRAYKMNHRAFMLVAVALMLIGLSSSAAARLEPQRATLRDLGPAPSFPGEIAAQTQLNGEASIQVAARQHLFDYAVEEALAILNATVKNTTIPEVNATVEVPLLGGIDVSVRQVNVTQLQVAPGLTRVAIEAGYYHAAAANVTANITFGWAWSKGPLGGSGVGELFLEGGALDAVFLVRNQEQGAPQVVLVSSGIAFQDLELSVHAASADWLYQALLYVFKGAVRRQIESAMDDALKTAVPNAINDALGTLPSALDIRGLPFRAVFTYAVYTLSYVVVKGYAEVDASDKPVPPSANTIHPWASAAACPFPATALPLSPAHIGGDDRAVSLYAHESVLNCVAWGLFHAGALNFTVKDGDIPGLRLITDLFGALVPDLPKAYPKHGIALQVTLSAPPTVTFTDGSGGVPPSRSSGLPQEGPSQPDVVVSASYTTVVSVLNATDDGTPLHVATLAANLSVSADFGWDATVLGEVNVTYAAVDGPHAVSTEGWSKAIQWAVQQAAPRLALSALWDKYVSTPVAPYFALERVTTGPVGGGWRGLSADVCLNQRTWTKLANKNG